MNRGTSAGSHLYRLTSSCVEAGEQGRNPQARKARLLETQGVSPDSSTKQRGKVVEKVVTALLAEEAERRRLLSNGHYGSRKRRSAIEAAAIIVDRVHAAWREGHIAGVPLMDIKAAFPSVRRGRLIHTMRGKRMDGDLIQWTASCHTDRTVEMVIESDVMERHPVEAGIPQGSPVSLILFAIYMSGLGKWAEERVSGAEGLSIRDDVRWVVTLNDFIRVGNKFEACTTVSIDWAE